MLADNVRVGGHDSKRTYRTDTGGLQGGHEQHQHHEKPEVAPLARGQVVDTGIDGQALYLLSAGSLPWSNDFLITDAHEVRKRPECRRDPT